jgi:hypothetical protein
MKLSRSSKAQSSATMPDWKPEIRMKHVDIPKWSALLVEAVNKPGMIMKADSAFHSYSIGNQILALVQCQMRGLEPGPINTFPGWQATGRTVKRGERALILCMPITVIEIIGVPYGSRTRVAAVKGRCPRPLDERDA